MLFDNPLRFLDFALYRLAAVIIALSFHEWAHAFVAYRCGDPTAKIMGRLTLNPLKHMDPVGTLLMFFAGFGWAKPVPVNPNNYHNGRRDDIKVSLAGIVTNLFIFLLCTFLGLWITRLLYLPEVLEYYTAYNLLNIKDGVILIHLAGMGEELSFLYLRPALEPLLRLVMQISLTNLYIGLFNLLPIPPMDGYHVLDDLILKGRFHVTERQSRMAMGLVLLLSFSGYLGQGLSFVADGLQGLLLKLF